MYRTSIEKFEEKLKNAFPKRQGLFTQSMARKVTGSHPHQLKKWLPEIVRQGKLRKANAYFFGCHPNELIVQDFGFGEVVICPACNSELPGLPEDVSKVVCENCGVEYVKGENDKWIMIRGVNNQGVILAWGIIAVSVLGPPLLWVAVNHEWVVQQIQEGWDNLCKGWNDFWGLNVQQAPDPASNQCDSIDAQMHFDGSQ